MMWGSITRWDLFKAMLQPDPPDRKAVRNMPMGDLPQPGYPLITVIPSPRPEDDRHGFEGNLKFVECATCKAKPGSPALCTSCLLNRAAIGNLTQAKRKASSR